MASSNFSSTPRKDFLSVQIMTGGRNPLFQNFFPLFKISSFLLILQPPYFATFCRLVCILQAILYFIDQPFAPFYRVFCKMANHHDIDPKITGSISDVNLDNPVKLACSEFAYPKVSFFQILVYNLPGQPDKLCQRVS